MFNSKKLKTSLILFFYIFFLSIMVSCKNDDDSGTQIPNVELNERVEVYNASEIEDSYVLVVKNGGDTSFLVNKQGDKLKEWNFDANLGNDLELLPDGRLIGIFKVEDPVFSFGGFGGVIKIINIDGSIAWEYTYASEVKIAHHDVELLPNGNVLFIAWEKIDNTTANVAGIVATSDIYPETLVEVNPTTNAIVWKWKSYDHLIQNTNSSLPTYGVISDNPQLIDFNYFSTSNGDIMHANGIDYDPIKDVIYLSVNYYNEIWVIDHSTTTVEAASNFGGNYNKGGDLIYRFGNPEAYNNTQGQRLFHNNHFPNLLEDNEPGAGNILVYENGNDNDQSTVYELNIPDNFNLIPNTNNEPAVVWSFTDTDLFSGRISGAIRLENGNTLIAEGDYGVWEVAPNKDIVWKYNMSNEGNIWRAYGYPKNNEAIINLGL